MDDEASVILNLIQDLIFLYYPLVDGKLQQSRERHSSSRVGQASAVQRVLIVETSRRARGSCIHTTILSFPPRWVRCINPAKCIVALSRARFTSPGSDTVVASRANFSSPVSSHSWDESGTYHSHPLPIPLEIHMILLYFLLPL